MQPRNVPASHSIWVFCSTSSAPTANWWLFISSALGLFPTCEIAFSFFLRVDSMLGNRVLWIEAFAKVTFQKDFSLSDFQDPTYLTVLSL